MKCLLVENIPKAPAKVPNEPRKNEARTKHKFDRVFHAIPFYGPIPPMGAMAPMVAYPPLNTLVKKKIEEVKEYELKGQSQNARHDMSRYPATCKSLNTITLITLSLSYVYFDSRYFKRCLISFL